MRDDETESHWYAIRTKSKKEEVANLNYKRQCYTVYLPLLRVTVRHARCTTEKLVAFFPGYLLLHLTTAEQNWTAIASTRGSLGAICFGDTYTEIPDWVINHLNAREDKESLFYSCKSPYERRTDTRLYCHIQYPWWRMCWWCCLLHGEVRMWMCYAISSVDRLKQRCH